MPAAAAISFCRPYASPTPLPPFLVVGSRRRHSYRLNFRPLKVTAAFSDYPLASRIVVKNLPYSVGESSLLKEFSNFGRIAEVKLVKDQATQMSKGYAFIQYSCQDEAVLALEIMDHKRLDGRVIYVELARPGKDAYHGIPRTCGPPPPTERVLDNENEKSE